MEINPPPGNMPRHVAIIMDGSGRWAKQRHMPRVAGHRASMESVRSAIRASSDWGIEVLTLYAFSTENWKRPRDEVDALMNLLVEFFAREIDELDRERVRIRILGDPTGLPASARKAAIDAQRRTRDNDGLRLCIALNYGGRDEIVRACRALCARAAAGEIQPGDITEDAFAQALDTAGLPDVDLVIRTSGEQRMSNLLPFQAAYAELAFPAMYWPDFDREAYARAIQEYQGRSRRYGGLAAR